MDWTLAKPLCAAVTAVQTPTYMLAVATMGEEHAELSLKYWEKTAKEEEGRGSVRLNTHKSRRREKQVWDDRNMMFVKW